MKPLIKYENVDVARAERTVLRGVNLEIYPGEFYFLTGRVGSGKTSLMKTMYADVPISGKGKANVLGYDLGSLKRKDIPMLRRSLGVVFQDFQLLQDRSVKGNLEFVLGATGWKNRHEMDMRIEEVLRHVGMANKSYKMPHELSGGEQQRIVIARALLNKPSLILADEPTGNLDPETGQNIVSLLHSLTRDGHAVVMITHNHNFIKEFDAHVLTCQDGELHVEKSTC